LAVVLAKIPAGQRQKFSQDIAAKLEMQTKQQLRLDGSWRCELLSSPLFSAQETIGNVLFYYFTTLKTPLKNALL